MNTENTSNISDTTPDNDNSVMDSVIETMTANTDPIQHPVAEIKAKSKTPAKAKKSPAKAKTPAKAKKSPAKAKSPTKSTEDSTPTPKNSRGRPAYQPKLPKAYKWTMKDFCEVNEVDYLTGRGPKCVKLTLINFKSKNLIGPDSLIVELDETRAPNSTNGIGAKQIVYALRSNLKAIKEQEAKAKSKKNSSLKATVQSDAAVQIQSQEASEFVPTQDTTLETVTDQTGE